LYNITKVGMVTCLVAEVVVAEVSCCLGYGIFVLTSDKSLYIDCLNYLFTICTGIDAVIVRNRQ